MLLLLAEHEFGEVEVDAFYEVDGLCLSWTLENDEPIWVNRVTAQNDGFFHHSNGVWVPDSLYDLPDGAWDCVSVPDDPAFEPQEIVLSVKFVDST